MQAAQTGVQATQTRPLGIHLVASSALLAHAHLAVATTEEDLCAHEAAPHAAGDMSGRPKWSIDDPKSVHSDPLTGTVNNSSTNGLAVNYSSANGFAVNNSSANGLVHSDLNGLVNGEGKLEGRAWARVGSSQMAKRTNNPIRRLVEGNKFIPNPNKSFIPLSLGMLLSAFLFNNSEITKTEFRNKLENILL